MARSVRQTCAVVAKLVHTQTQTQTHRHTDTPTHTHHKQGVGAAVSGLADKGDTRCCQATAPVQQLQAGHEVGGPGLVSLVLHLGKREFLLAQVRRLLRTPPHSSSRTTHTTVTTPFSRRGGTAGQATPTYLCGPVATVFPAATRMPPRVVGGSKRPSGGQCVDRVVGPGDLGLGLRKGAAHAARRVHTALRQARTTGGRCALYSGRGGMCLEHLV